jgi:hypothetical protein
MTCVLIDLFSPEKYINKLTDCCGNFIVYLEKIVKNMIFFWRKIVIFHMKYPKNFARPPLNWKNVIFFGVKS